MEIKNNDILAAIRSSEDHIKYFENAPVWKFGKRQRKRAIQLEQVKIVALKKMLEG